MVEISTLTCYSFTSTILCYRGSRAGNRSRPRKKLACTRAQELHRRFFAPTSGCASDKGKYGGASLLDFEELMNLPLRAW